MEDILRQILEEQKKTTDRLTAMDCRLATIESRLDTIEAQLDENTQITKAIIHNQEVSNAKLEGIELTTAKAESIVHTNDKIDLLDTKFDLLNNRLFAQETQSALLLKRIK